MMDNPPYPRRAQDVALCAARPYSLKWARRSITLTPPLICECAHAAMVEKSESGDYSTDGHNCRDGGRWECTRWRTPETNSHRLDAPTPMRWPCELQATRVAQSSSAAAHRPPVRGLIPPD